MKETSIGQLCRAARLARGLSLKEAGHLTGYAGRTVSDFERGERWENLFSYACRFARAIGDMDLLRRIIEAEIGVPAAGRPIPEGIDRHVAALRDLALKEKSEAIEALRSLAVWRPGEEQREKVLEAARELLDAIDTSEWVLDALCAWAHIDRIELRAKLGGRSLATNAA